MNSMYDSAERVLSWLREPAGELFLDYIKGLSDSERKAILKAGEPRDFYRLQGTINAYTVILELQNNLRQLIEDKKLGRRK